MTAWVALLRAVNVGGTGLLRMRDLVAACRDLGVADPRTLGASGNVVFAAEGTEATLASALSAHLAPLLGRPAEVLLRDTDEFGQVLSANPFRDADPRHTVAILLPAPPPADALDSVAGQADEQLALGPRAIYVHYPSGQGRSRLHIPAATAGTARNLNTLERLRALLGRTGGE